VVISQTPNRVVLIRWLTARGCSPHSDLVDHLRYHTSLTNTETELASCTSARAANAAYIWSGHARLGRQAGTRGETLHYVKGVQLTRAWAWRPGLSFLALMGPVA
jgi:hypothetical protein